jgi:hypothetical protein
MTDQKETRPMQKTRRVSIEDLTALKREIPDESLQWVSGGSGTKHIVMEPILVIGTRPPGTCTSENRTCDTD